MKTIHILSSLNPYGGTPKKVIKYIKSNNNSINIHTIWMLSLYSESYDYNGVLSCLRSEGVMINDDCINKSIIGKVIGLVKYIKSNGVPCNVISYYSSGHIVSIIVKLFCRQSVIVSFVGPFDEKNIAKRCVNLFLYRFIDYVIYNSFYTKNEKEKQYLTLASIDNDVVYNGIEEYVKKKKIYSIGNAQIKLISIGGLVDWKNHIFIINLIDYNNNILRSDNKYYLKILGDGDMFYYLNDYILNKNLSDYISLEGYVSNVNEYLVNSDIYLHPATDEAFGISVIEAQSAGLPAIVANKGALPELIVNGYNGFVCNLDYQDWKRCVDTITSSSSVYKEFSDNAKYHINKKFNSNIYNERYNIILEKMGSSEFSGD